MRKKVNVWVLAALLPLAAIAQVPYPIVDTDVQDHYSTSAIIPATSPGQAFHGQDATYPGNQPSYTDNGDGTISDNVTGLMWEQDMGAKITWADAFTKAANSTLGGHSDWRVPTIKELFSLAYFSGRCMGDFVVDKFIDTVYFNQPIGNTNQGEREIDAQTWSSTQYVGLTMGGDTTIFGYNFVDGRLKGYPKYDPQSGNPKTLYCRLVRGPASYGINDFGDNGNGTLTDNATGLMWQQADDGNTRTWEQALAYAENLNLGGHSDWRLPNAKELHSILDYSRSPSTTNSPGIDPLFTCTSFLNPEGDPNYGYYWTGSPLKDGTAPYSDAVYLCFGRAEGQMEVPPGSGNFQLMDTHGAGAVRNDPKEEAPGTSYPTYWGPQGDVVYVHNYVRCVRDARPTGLREPDGFNFELSPNPARQAFLIHPPERIDQVMIYKSQGKEVQRVRVNRKFISVSTENLANGVYIVRAITASEKTTTRKLMIMK